MVIDEALYKTIRNLVNEELGINSQVSNAVDEIHQLLTNDSVEMRDIPIGKNRHWPCKATNIDYPFVDSKIIRLNICIYDFPSENDMLSYRKQFPQEWRNIINAKTHQSDEWSKVVITGNLIRVNGKDDINFYNWLQHELTHAFQRLKSNKTELVKDVNKYQNNIKVIGKSTEEYVRNAARINYYSFKHEQDAFANGLYSVLIHSNCTKDNIDEIICGTKFYAILTKLKKVINEFSRLKGDEFERVDSMIRSNFNYGVDVVIKKGLRDIEEFTYRMGRVKMKILNELDY